MHLHSEMHRLKIGILYTLLAWLFLTFSSTLARFASEASSIPTVLLFQNLICLICTLPWAFKHGKDFFKTQRPGLIFIRALCAVSGFALIILGLQHTTLVDTILLSNSAPLFTPFIVRIWLKNKIDHKLWPGILIGFLGIALILQPGKTLLNIGALYSLAAGVIVGIAMLSLRILSYTEKNHTVIFYLFLFSTGLSLFPAIYFWKPINLETLTELITIGISSMLGHFALAKSFHYGKVSHLAPFSYSAVIYAGILQWLIWGSVPGPLALLGVILVCAGGIFTLIYARPPSQT